MKEGDIKGRDFSKHVHVPAILKIFNQTLIIESLLLKNYLNSRTATTSLSTKDLLQNMYNLTKIWVDQRRGLERMRKPLLS